MIGETAVIGKRVRLYQAVTLGAKRFPTDADGTLQKGLPRHPVVEDDVVIYAGATMLGRVTIGRGASSAATSGSRTTCRPAPAWPRPRRARTIRAGRAIRPDPYLGLSTV